MTSPSPRTVNVKDEIEQLVRTGLLANRVMDPDWITQTVIDHYPALSGTDTDFYLICAYGHVRSVVRSVVQGYKRDKDATRFNRQMLLPGFNRLQIGYLVERGKQQCLVPSVLMTLDEWKDKRNEIAQMADGCLEHIQEIDRFVAQKFGV